MSLRTRMAAAAGVAVALAVLASAVAIHIATRAELRGQIDRFLETRVQNFQRDPRSALSERPPPAPNAMPFGGPSGFVQLVTPNGTAFRPVDENRPIPVDESVLRVAASGQGRILADREADGVPLRVLTVGMGPRGAFQVARPLTEVDAALRRQLLVLAAVGSAGIALAVLLGLVVARTALAPILAFTRRTESIAAEPDLTQRLEIEGRDELARLAQSFNMTLEALERSARAQRNLVADASHELRTPIATVRANLQLLQDADRLSPEDRESLRRDMIEELDELTGLVADLVELARGGTRAAVLDDVRLDEVAHGLAERLRSRNGGLEVEEDLEPTVVRGEPDRITRAVSNLLDNARKWSPPGGVIALELRDGVLSVRDHGPGFAPEDLPHVFSRFYRADAARQTPGSGLGLAIVREAALAHGGTAEALNAPGGGALLRVSFGTASRPGGEGRTQPQEDAAAV